MHTSHEQGVLREADLHHHPSHIRCRQRELLQGLQVKVASKLSNDLLIEHFWKNIPINKPGLGRWR